MKEEQKHIEALHDIKDMMNRSSRFISLSGLSGISAGLCALAATIYIWPVWLAVRGKLQTTDDIQLYPETNVQSLLTITGVFTFLSALLLAFLFTWMRSKKTNTSIWGSTAKRLMINTAIPLIAGAFVTYRLLELELIGLIAPSCLIFYGLALLNGSKYTVSEIRWLGLCQIILGVINLWFIGYGLIAWAIGFGVLHILYGALMWWKYERV
jgi:hypothetical protein